MLMFLKKTTQFLSLWMIMTWLTHSCAQNVDHSLLDKKMADLLQKQNCLNCHAMEQKKLGPSFMQIAQKFPRKTAVDQARIVRSIQYGSRGQWGVVPMMGSAKISDAQSQQIAQWILSLPLKKIENSPKNNIH